MWYVTVHETRTADPAGVYASGSTQEEAKLAAIRRFNEEREVEVPETEAEFETVAETISAGSDFYMQIVEIEIFSKDEFTALKGLVETSQDIHRHDSSATEFLTALHAKLEALE